MATVICALALALMAQRGLAAEESDPRLSTSVSSVVTIANLKHSLRVVVETIGFEHLSSRVYCQWLVQDSDTASERLVSSVLIKEVGDFLSIGMPAVSRVGDSFRVVLHGTNNRTLKEKEIRLIAGPPGQYRIIE